MKLRLLALASLRFYGRHPWQLILAVAGIALGVGVFVGIELANDSARRAFTASSSAASEQTTHRLLPVTDLLPESIYRDLKRDSTTVASAPIIEASVSIVLPDGRELPVPLEGIDIIEEAAVRGLRGVAASSADPVSLMARPGAVLLPDAIAQRLGIVDGDTLNLRYGTRSTEVVSIGAVSERPNGATPILADIASAQEITGRSGFLSRIDLRIDDAVAATLTASLPDGAVLVPAATEDLMLRELTRAFNTNLTALGLLALVVGMFLIYSTISFTIVQRWRSIAVLRAIGLERRELLLKLLTEALAIGIVGTLLGLALGRALSTGLLELVLRTLDDLYFRRALQGAEPSGWIYAGSAVLGIGATLLSALVPAVMASRREISSATRSRLERNARRLANRFAWASLPTLAVAFVLLEFSGQGLWQAFVALFLMLVAGAMLIPLATHGLMHCSENPVAALAGLPGRMATRGVTDSLSRTGVATAALAVAVATVISIGLMIASFRASLIEWIDTTITADLYIDIDPDWPGDLETTLGAIEAAPAIAGLSRQRTARLTTAIGELTLRAQAPGPAGYGIDLVAPSAADPAALLAAGSLLISEPLAYRLNLVPGATLALPTADGNHAFTIGGIYRDYNTAGSALILSLDAYRASFDDTAISTVGAHLAPGSDEAQAIAAIRAALGPERRTRIRSTANIRNISLNIFDRTFQVTEVLRLLAGTVAFLGILSALMALGLEREREFAVLRSLGMSIRQLFGQNLAQTGLLGLTAGLAAVPLGALLAWVLIHVINQRSFGWSMDYVLSFKILASGIVMAVIAALLAGIYPAFVGARADMGLAWRDD